MTLIMLAIYYEESKFLSNVKAIKRVTWSYPTIYFRCVISKLQSIHGWVIVCYFLEYVLSTFIMCRWRISMKNVCSEIATTTVANLKDVLCYFFRKLIFYDRFLFDHEWLKIGKGRASPARRSAISEDWCNVSQVDQSCTVTMSTSG